MLNPGLNEVDPGACGNGPPPSIEQERDLRLQQMIDALPGAIYVTDAQGMLTHFNAGAVEFSGRLPQLGTDRWCINWKLYNPDGTPLPHDQCPMAQCLRTGRAIRGAEAIAERPDGRKIWFAAYPSPLFDASGQLVGGINMLVDITERKQAEESRVRLASIVESSDDAIISKTLDGVVTSWNQAAERLFGYSANEAIGEHIQLIIPVERHSEEEEVLARLRRGEKIDHFETVRQAKNGRRMNISLTVSPLRASDGRIIGASKVARDITDRKLAEQALLEADRRKNEFLATLAHELRNPLAPIRNSLHLLRMQDSTPAAERVHDMLERQVTHLVRLVDDLLEISRINSGKIELRKEPVELAAVVRTALEISRPLIDAGGHQLAIALPREPITVEADPVRLSQIIANLLNNAAKYTDPGGQIWLTADRQAGEAVILVRDTGIGLAADVLPRVFDMFTQVDRDHKRAQGGLGIGLALVKRLAELHGGRVEARSAGEGKGSEFSIHLPLARQRAAASMETALLRPGTGGTVRRRVLIVDDNRDAAASLALLLKLLGSEAQTANDGPSALQTAEIYRPDLVLLDLGMPGMSGFDVARHLRQHPELCKVTLIALTGWGQEDDRRRTQEAGFDNHLVKPVDLVALSSLIAGVPASSFPAARRDSAVIQGGAEG